MAGIQALLRQRDADLEERGRLLLKTKVSSYADLLTLQLGPWAKPVYGYVLV